MSGGARVLVVDDEPGTVRALRTNLAGHGFQVETAETGTAALASCRQHKPDLIILDLGLPDMDGTQVIRAVRLESSVPILGLSVRGAERDKMAALDLGGGGYLTQPVG